MKLALIFIPALVAMTKQQLFHQQPVGMPWWSPSSYPQMPSVVTNHQEIYYNNNFQDNIPSFRRPVPHFTQNNAELHPSFSADDYQSSFMNDEEEFSDTQSRKKVSKVRIRPNKLSQQKPRFFYNYYTNVNSILTKTATFTLTTILSITTVQSCIAAANFAAVPPVACRRKRDLPDSYNPEDIQVPTETQSVIQTAFPSLDMDGELSLQLSADDTISPKDLSSLDNISGSMSSENNLREKRFFRYSVSSLTVTTYSLVSTTVTKTVDIGTGLLCLPSGWVTC